MDRLMLCFDLTYRQKGNLKTASLVDELDERLLSELNKAKVQRKDATSFIESIGDEIIYWHEMAEREKGEARKRAEHFQALLKLLDEEWKALRLLLICSSC